MVDWLNPLATLAASFAGAWAAFRLQASDKSKEVRRSNIAAANQALFIMMQQANTLSLYQHDHINPNRNHPGCHLAIQASLPYELDKLRFDFASLEFLDSAKERQLTFELSIEEQRYLEALRAINARSEIILTEVHPRMSAAGFLDGGTYDANQIINAIGQPLFKKLERLTNDMIWHVDRTSESIVVMKDRFLSAVRTKYPGVNFVDFELHQPKKAE